ncbi:hypothetical protein [Legionella sp. km772]|uniref:hypothetical protein n=1 Tax=Legionella sp. km772 TaxID=2498111 RepID=UPI000F8CF7EF|nr:hypothetical protein [Legionella sp. km772]RUR14261.1 hypothetical protein ELY15_00420 [Legionella sp. km772]
MKVIEIFKAIDHLGNKYEVTVTAGTNISPDKNRFIEGLRTYRLQDNRTVTPIKGKDGFFKITNSELEIKRL